MSPYFALHDLVNVLCFCVATDQFGPRPTSLFRFIVHTETYKPDGPPLNERSVRRRGCYIHSTRQTQQTNISALRWIRSRDPSIRAAAELRLRPHGYMERSINISRVFPRYITCPHLESHNISSPTTNKLYVLLRSFVISDEILYDTVEYLELIPICADVPCSTSTKPDCDYMTHNDTKHYITS
jgi:hypothetical protein